MADTLTTALRLLANNIDCEDGVAIAVVLQAAGEIDRLRERLDELRFAADQADVEYRAEIERLREAIRRLAEQDATLSVCDGAVTVTMDATLTDDETDLLLWLSSAGDEDRITHKSLTPAARETLRGLLERTK